MRYLILALLFVSIQANSQSRIKETFIGNDIKDGILNEIKYSNFEDSLVIYLADGFYKNHVEVRSNKRLLLKGNVTSHATTGITDYFIKIGRKDKVRMSVRIDSKKMYLFNLKTDYLYVLIYKEGGNLNVTYTNRPLSLE